MQLDNDIEKSASSCNDIISGTFRNILFDFKDVNIVKKEIEILNSEIRVEKNKVSLEDIIGLKGDNSYKFNKNEN